MPIQRLHKTTRKPWGAYYDYAQEAGRWHLKALFIKKGERLSLQKHRLRTEYHLVVRGTVRMTKGKTTRILGPGMLLKIPRGTVHRMAAVTNAVIIEVTLGIHRENDIVRLADDYGRAPDKAKMK
jgi:mannose-1-phosphate guanylyltransferase/mannose-1-phosphate guanylyltransferase/mannose-6-phosphate isomerase